MNRPALPAKIAITPDQRRALERIWFTYGNGGPKHTHGNHRFIQTFLEHGEDSRKFYRRKGRVLDWKPVTLECESEVDAILGGAE